VLLLYPIRHYPYGTEAFGTKAFLWLSLPQSSPFTTFVPIVYLHSDRDSAIPDTRFHGDMAGDS